LSGDESHGAGHRQKSRPLQNSLVMFYIPLITTPIIAKRCFYYNSESSSPRQLFLGLFYQGIHKKGKCRCEERRCSAAHIFADEAAPR
jgi:hypothetical protein